MHQTIPTPPHSTPHKDGIGKVAGGAGISDTCSRGILRSFCGSLLAPESILSRAHAPNIAGPNFSSPFQLFGLYKGPVSHPPWATPPQLYRCFNFSSINRRKRTRPPVGQNEEEEVEKSFFPGFFTKFAKISALSNRQSVAHPAGHRRTMEST